MEETFSPGDVVLLKSGGPKMTIEDIGKYGMGATHDSAKMRLVRTNEADGRCFRAAFAHENQRTDPVTTDAK